MTMFFRRIAIIFLSVLCLVLCCACQTTPTSNTSTEDLLVPNNASDFDYDTFEKDGERVIRLIRYKGERTDVVIPDTIEGLPVRILLGVTAQNDNGYTGVVQGVFEDTAIESVYIPSSVSSLGLGTFAHCTKLEQVEFAKGCGITSLDTSVFESCIIQTTKLKGRILCYKLQFV